MAKRSAAPIIRAMKVVMLGDDSKSFLVGKLIHGNVPGKEV